MWKNEAHMIHRLRALMLLTVMVWLGGALVGHTLSHHHLHDHLHTEGHSLVGEDEQCILFLFTTTPFSTVIASGVPGVAYIGDITYQISTIHALYAEQSAHPSLRAPPAY